MKSSILILFLFLFGPFVITAQILGKIIDANDKSSLPFSTVVGPNSYAIANEQGEFNYRGELGDSLAISFLGYRDTIVIAKNNMVVKMVNDGIYSEEVVITDANYISPYKLLLSTKKRYTSLDHDIVPSKLFVKRESINNGVWSDQTEMLYAAKQNKGKVYDLSFQHGKSYVNSENDLIFTLDLMAVLQEEEIFSKYSKYLYTSACSLGSKKKIKKNYLGNYKEWQSNGKEFYIISTKSKNKDKFDSELTVSAVDYDLVRLKQMIKNPEQVAFRSLRTNEPIQLDSLSLDYIFDTWNGRKVISSLVVTYSYLLNGIHSKNNIKLKFFDYGNPYTDLISSIDYELLTDYQKIWNTPYNDEFWSGQKLTFSKLDTLSQFEDMNINSSFLLLKKRYLTLEDVKRLGVSYFEHIPLMDDGVGAMIKFDPLDMKTQRHLHAHFFVHLYEVDDLPKVQLVPLIDHQRSFIMQQSPMMDSLFLKEIDVVNITFSEASEELSSMDIVRLPESAKAIRKLVKRYNNLLKNRLSKLDAHQNRDWSARPPEYKRVNRW